MVSDASPGPRVVSLVIQPCFCYDAGDGEAMTMSVPGTPLLLAASRLALVVLVVFSAGVSFSGDACASDCACDHEPTHIAGQADMDHEEPEPCPDGCTDCHCCPGNVVCALPAGIVVVLHSPGARTRDGLEEMTMAGSPNNVFRPPR